MNVPYRLSVIGAGQLGSRHLQGLVRLSAVCEIHIVDPSAASLEIARQRAAEVPESARHRLFFHQKIDQLPKSLDYAVVATTADVRLSVLRALLHNRTVPNLLLEKVLFQRETDYDAAGELLQKAGSRTWVNCPRRAFPIYDKLQTFFSDDALQHVDVRGGDWGLGCNSIHFIDLIALLAGGTPHALSTQFLHPDLIDSKRVGFKEFTGTLLGCCGTAGFSLTATRGVTAPLLITFRGSSKSCIVDESAGRAFLHDPRGGWHTLEFQTPLLSELAMSIARRILLEGTSVLTPYAQSVSYHLPMLQALGAHASRYLGTTSDVCPIT